MPVIDSRGTRPIVQSGDLAFLQQKEQEGKLKSARGTLSTTGTLASITAGANKDLYLASAKVIFYLNILALDSSVADKVELQLNGVTIETATHSTIVATGVSTFEYEFKNISQKVLAGEAIRLQVTALDTSVDVEGFIECYEESSGSQSFGGQEVSFNVDSGDLSFLRSKSISGDLVFLQDELTGTASASITPAIGKTFFYYKGFFINRSSVNQSDFEILNDGAVRLKQRLLSTNNEIIELGFVDSLVGDGIKTFSVSHTNTGLLQFSLYGWLEDT